MIFSFILSFSYFYSSSSSPLLIRGSPGTAQMLLCQSFRPKRHRQLRAKDSPKVPAWRLERDSDPQPFRRKATNLPMSHHVPNLSDLTWLMSNIVGVGQLW